MNASYSARMLPPAPTFSPATFHDTEVSVDPSEVVWKIRSADAIRRLCASAMARSRQPRSKTDLSVIAPRGVHPAEHVAAGRPGGSRAGCERAEHDGEGERES